MKLITYTFPALIALIAAMMHWATTSFGQNLSSGVLTTVFPATNTIPPNITVPSGQGRLQVDVGDAVGYSITLGGSSSLIPGAQIEILGQIGSIPTPQSHANSGLFVDELTVAASVLNISSPPAGKYYFLLAPPPSDGSGVQFSINSYQIRATYFPKAPVITVQPASESIPVGGSVTFGVTAIGTNLVYQWYKNNTAIGGANSATYIIYSVVTTDAGRYDGTVTNAGGKVTSNVATLTVPTGPSITAQ